MHYLVLGANGLIGKSLCKNLAFLGYPFTGTYRKVGVHKGLKCDILNEKDLINVLQAIKPNVVINVTNLAGGVDFCEHNPKLARRFHYETNVKIGEFCKKSNARMVLISTDYVFDGKNPPYKEDDGTNPLNIYGKLKLEAEKWIMNNVSKYTIVRTTNVFGWDPKTVTPNYIMNLYRTIKDNKQFYAPSFLWGNPTYVDDLASAIIELCSIEADGIFHVVGSSYINRYEWALKTCEIAGWDQSLIIETKNIPENVVPRPLKSSLDTAKFRALCETVLKDVVTGIKAFLADMKNSPEVF
jgi:dTDP-4-dehydrorhamnose reductase